MAQPQRRTELNFAISPSEQVLRQLFSELGELVNGISDDVARDFDSITTALLQAERPFEVILDDGLVRERARSKRSPLERQVIIKLELRPRTSLALIEVIECHFISPIFNTISLREANFRNCLFVDAKFKQSDCSDANFVNCRLGAIEFDDCTLNGANFSETRLQSCSFQPCRGSRIVGTNFARCDLTGSNFQLIEMASLVFDRSVARGCMFHGATMKLCSCRFSDFGISHFDECELQDCILDFADLSWSTMRDARFSSSGAHRVSARYADFSECNLEGAEFTGLDLTGAKFCAADLHNTRFTNCILEGCDFRRSVLGEATFGDDCNSELVRIDNMTTGRQYVQSFVLDD